MAYPTIDTGLTRPGEAYGGSTDPLELFLKKFSGEVITLFEHLNMLKPFVRMRTLRRAKSAQFPVLGRASAGYFSPGQNLLQDSGGLLTQFEQIERVIYADKKLVAGTTIDEWDDLINHYEVRQEYTRELAQALAREFDYNVLKVLAVGANTAATGTGSQFPGGTRLDINDGGTEETDGAALVAHLFTSAKTLDNNYVPQDGNRWAILSPTAYYAICQQKDVIDSDYTVMRNGGLDTGKVKQVAGINLLSCPHVGDVTFRDNHLSTAHGMTATELNDYVVDCTKTRAFVFHTSALGGVTVQDLSFESEWLIEYQAWLLLAKFIMGLRPLRPEAIVEWYDSV